MICSSESGLGYLLEFRIDSGHSLTISKITFSVSPGTFRPEWEILRDPRFLLTITVYC